jgi:hypothetical protein
MFSYIWGAIAKATSLVVVCPSHRYIRSRINGCVMTIKFFYEPLHRLLSLSALGNVTSAERYECINSLNTSLNLPERFTVLLDISGTLNDPDAAELASLGAFVSSLQKLSHSRVAIVNSSVGQATSSHIVAIGCGDEVEAFFSEKEARVWLSNADI